MTSQTGTQTITIHMLSDISWILDNEIWSVNRTYFSLKFTQKMKQED